MERTLTWTLCTAILAQLVLSPPIPLYSQTAAGGNPELEKKIEQVFSQLPPIRQHFENVTEAQALEKREQEQNHRKLSLERREGKWAAALVEEKTLAIQNRFETIQGLLDFAQEHRGLLEVWAYAPPGQKARRIPATEIAELQKEKRQQPTFLTMTFAGADGKVVVRKVEFSYKAAEESLVTQQGYSQHRQIQRSAQEILGARDSSGRISAQAQWERLMKGVLDGTFPMREIPQEPRNPEDVFVAFEFEVNEFNQLAGALRVYRESEVERRVVEDRKDQYVQVLVLKKGRTEREVRGFRKKPDSDELEPLTNPVPGQDAVELRVRDAREPRARRWNVVEFGEPELIREAALSKFSLLSAHLEKNRKEIAIRKSNLDLIAEPIFAGLNVGAGLVLVPFPLGEAARLGYNAAVTPWFIPEVPTVQEMRELFQVLAAKDKNPALKTKPAEYLNKSDLETLERQRKQLSDQEVRDYLERTSEEDIRAMLRLPKYQQIDARVSNLLGIMADAGKVSGWTEERGFQRDVFNSIYFSVTGEISIKNIIAILAGGSVVTPNSGVSLKALSEGRGPAEAWLQFLNVTVDLRAVVNTVARISHSSLAGKELKKPFPYAPRLTDVAAYEIRVFGFPLLIFHKRGLLKDDYRSFTNDYAYGLIGTRIVEHFATKEEMDNEIRAGNMMPLGYVRVFDGKGTWKNSNLAVFAHRVPGGRNKGKTTTIIYGLKAYRENSELIEREYHRFKQFQQALEEGGVIEQVVSASERPNRNGGGREPEFFPGPRAVEERFRMLLGVLLEWRRLQVRERLGLQEEAELRSQLRKKLEELGAAPESPLLEVDQYNSSFIWRERRGEQSRDVRVTLIPSPAEMARQTAKAREGVRVEKARRIAVSAGGPGALLIHEARERNGEWQIGPLIEDASGEVIGTGVRADGLEEILARIQELPVTDQARFEEQRFASMLLDWDGRKAFVTIEFPLDREIGSTALHASTGEKETKVFEEGALRRILTARRITEIERNLLGKELQSTTYRNSGSLKNPVRGPLLEQTRTLDIWHRDLSAQTPAPASPTLSKVKASYVTGRIEVETYGYFFHPIFKADEFLVTSNRFDDSGKLSSAVSWENEAAGGELAARLLQPRIGRERFQFTRSSLETPAGMLRLDRIDSIKGTSKSLVLDLGNGGRTVQELWAEEGGLQMANDLDYRPGFYEGEVPFRTVLRSVKGGFLHSTTETLSYEPITQGLQARTLDYTGRSVIQSWRAGLETPVEIQSSHRKTTVQIDRSETRCSTITRAIGSGEVLGVASGTFDINAGTWNIEQTLFHSAGVTNRTETQTLSGHGRVLQTTIGKAFQTRPVYGPDGNLISLQRYRPNPATKAFDILLETKSGFTWSEGSRNATVELFRDGKLLDRYQEVDDEEGRLSTNGWRRTSDFEVMTRFVYEGDSDRVAGSETLQNGLSRSKTRILQPVKQGDGTYAVTAITEPAWGLVCTQVFVLGELYGRAVRTIYENGEEARVIEWLEGTSLPKTVEKLDRRGLVKERSVLGLEAGLTNAMPLLRAKRFQVSPWGKAELAEERVFIANTEITVFQEARGLRTYYDVSKPYEAPAYSVDLSGKTGVSVKAGRAVLSNVVEIFQTTILTNRGVIQRDGINLRGLFSQQFTRQLSGRSGEVLEERIGRVGNPGQKGFSRETLFGADPEMYKFVQYRYEPAWLVESGAEGNRQLAFQTSAPPSTARSIRCNDGPWPEFPTRVSISQTTSDAKLDSDLLRRFISRELQQPRVLEKNPFMPDRKSNWTSWTALERKYSGEIQFTEEVVYDSQGRLCVAKAQKRSSAGGRAFKMRYLIPPCEDEDLRKTDSETMEIPVPSDLSPSDWVYLQAAGANETNLVLEAQDAGGHLVRVRATDADPARGNIRWWPMEEGLSRWIPNKFVPEQEIEISADAPSGNGASILAASVHDLARAGLDIRHVSRVILRHTGSGSYGASKLYVLNREGKFSPLAGTLEPELSVIKHSSGLRTVHVVEKNRTEQEVLNGRRIISTVDWNGVPVTTAQTRSRHSGFPPLILKDHSDGDAARMLYAISPEDGHLMEHYKNVRMGDAQVYTVAQGFDLPRIEIYRGRYLEDEAAPSLLSFGKDYGLTISVVRGRNPLSHLSGLMHERVVANAFNYAGKNLFQLSDPSPERRSQFDYFKLHHSGRQAEDIRRLPTLATALIAAQALPWSGAAFAERPEPIPRMNELRYVLAKLHLASPTGLIPTAPRTAQERYVRTVDEMKIVHLALKLGDLVLARELLDFYWNKAEGGQKPLHESYDAVAGTAMAVDVRYRRPVHARRTAEAQLAVAEAAFALGFQTSDAKWLTLGRNLLQLTLRNFRAEAEAKTRGISEQEFQPAFETLGFSFWPEAETYSLRSNARAYLLLKQLSRLVPQYFSDAGWVGELSAALRDEESWLRDYILSEAEQSGVPPKGMFTIQDIHNRTTALGSERSTATEDWLWLLEAADEIGVPRASSRQWLENLAKAHGVQIGLTWGLDWQIPILRPDAISPELTAWFGRVAHLLEHPAAEQFAEQNLRTMLEKQGFPAAITAGPAVRPMRAGENMTLFPLTNSPGWPAIFAVQTEITEKARPGWNLSRTAAKLRTKPVDEVWPPQRGDLTIFLIIAGLFYLLVLASTFFWWRFRALRRKETAAILSEDLVPEKVMGMAEERWAKQVLGMTFAEGAEKSRYSNAPVEHNFLMQLRAIYKLVVEWRRQENQWEEAEPRLAQDNGDGWLRGMDEYASIIGIYMRYVIKAGAKDGFDRESLWAENEDSNHIWSRLVMYFAEYYWAFLTLSRNYQNQVLPEARAGVSLEIAQLLSRMGVRQRAEPFDARVVFNWPENAQAMDLLALQKPGMTLQALMEIVSIKLGIPIEHIERMLGRYKEFKRREQPYPIHPYTIEAAKLLPHFVLMGLGALVWYNQRIGDSPIVPYLWSLITHFALTAASLWWAVPLFLGILVEVAANFVRIYRFEAPMLERTKASLFLDATVTSFFGKQHSVLPKAREGKWWNPKVYRWSSWGLRVAGCLFLGLDLLHVEAPSFATFLVVKGLLAPVAFLEVAAIVLPICATLFSKALQDHVTGKERPSKSSKFVNRLNVTATRPASPLWLSFKYHTQPSVPTGDWLGMTQAIAFFFVIGVVFFGVGGYLTEQILSLWFTDTYLNADNWKLFFGGLLFWNTMYLLRYGLFLLFTGVASFCSNYPLKFIVGMAAASYLLLEYLQPGWNVEAFRSMVVQSICIAAGLMAILLENEILQRARRLFGWRRAEGDICETQKESQSETSARSLFQIAMAREQRTLGIVYMSGDELCARKLTPELLMTRWAILRDQLGSRGTELAAGAAGASNDSAVREAFQELYRLEQEHKVTLWHPSQLSMVGEKPALAAEIELCISVQSEEERRRVLGAWHLRRWLVSMMSTAGHSQDTAINLAEIAVKMAGEKLGAHTVFYLVQNKYDNSESNRPSQAAYGTGELGERDKLARLLCALAPGARAYSVQNWTPFGFKAGGLTGMDLAHEETMRLTSMLLLDRNATVHDLDALIVDLKRALSDPDVVIVIPGRSTTNTLTCMGQGSQMVEEGHRSFLKGLMSFMGGTASEAVGTGWGNLLAVFYGRVQRAMVNAQTLKMPLTSRMQRGSSFQMQCEGLIGFTPHAVGISEDTWAVSQAAHNAIALGQRVKFLVSKAMWHKIRETWSHAEWLASFPRWSGGYLQMMHDPLMQKINDFGPASVFAKEVRANSGRNFLSAPFALCNILFMPLAIMLDLTPFVQILIVLWNFGFIMNQILTVHGLNTYLESSGFQRLPALLAGIIGAAFAYSNETLTTVAPALILGGFLAGGFFVGFSRWLYTRLRDMLLFGPQLVLHALGQVVRQTLEFQVSGASPEDAKGVNMAFRTMAGPREDKPLEPYLSFINLRTVVWGFGMSSLALNLVALANLDMLNVLLLLPSLLFSVSTLAGPFLLKPKVGKPLGMLMFLPKALGWICAVSFYILVSMLLAGDNRSKLLGLVLVATVFGTLLLRCARYWNYRPRLRRLCRQMAQGLPRPPSTPLWKLLLGSGGDRAKFETAILWLGYSKEEMANAMGFADRKLFPVLHEPAQGGKALKQSRFISELNRSLALALLVLVWFFVVPIPGLFVFTAGDYRISLDLWKIMTFIGVVIGIVIVGSWIGQLLQWIEANGPNSLRKKLERAFLEFQKLTSAEPQAGAGLYALFTDAQMYMDQRSHAYARELIVRIEAQLKSLRKNGQSALAQPHTGAA